MRIAAQNINNAGIKISKKKLIDATEKYTKQYYMLCQDLYEYGYISSPTYFFEEEFWQAFNEEFTDILHYFVNYRTGKMEYSVDTIDYVIAIVGYDSSAYKVLRLVKKLLEARKALEDLALLADTAKFGKKNDLVTCKASLTVSHHVYNSSKLPLDSPYVRECFYIPDDYSVIEFDYTIELLKNALRGLGVDDDISLTDKSLFLGDNFTIEDDCRFFNQIISGTIKGSGKYADLLYSTIESYYSDYYNTRTTSTDCQGYDERNFVIATQSCIDAVNGFRSKITVPYSEFYVTSNKVYFLIKDEVATLEIKRRNRYIGEVCIDYESGKPLSLINRLLGFSGEYIYMYSPDIMNYKVSGVPVTMYQLGTSRNKIIPVAVQYYPIANVKQEYKDSLVNIYPKTRSGDIKYMKVSDMLNNLGVSSLESLASEVVDVLSDSVSISDTYGKNADSFRNLVGLMIQSLCCMMCDYTLAGHESPNHIILGKEYDWVSEDIYLDACIEAEVLFKKLGF